MEGTLQKCRNVNVCFQIRRYLLPLSAFCNATLNGLRELRLLCCQVGSIQKGLVNQYARYFFLVLGSQSSPGQMLGCCWIMGADDVIFNTNQYF